MKAARQKHKGPPAIFTEDFRYEQSTELDAAVHSQAGRGCCKQATPPPRRKADPFPVPEDSLHMLSEKIQAGEARIVLSPGADFEVFRQAFVETWEQILGADRHRLLSYWRENDEIDRDLRRTSIPIPPKPRPNLLLLADSEIPEDDTECRSRGHVLAFRVSLTTNNRERLGPAIARVLAKAYGTITGIYVDSELALDETFIAWADAHLEASQEDRDRAWQPLVDEHMRRYRKLTNEILQRWGFPVSEEASA